MTTRMETEMLGAGLINACGPVWDGASSHAPRLRQMNFIHGITPQTAHSTPYWSILTRDVCQDDDVLSQMLIIQNKAILDQDVECWKRSRNCLPKRGHFRSKSR